MIDTFNLKSTGIWSVLSEQCSLPRGSPNGFIEGVSKHHKKGKIVSGINPRRDGENFKVQHSYDKVQYMVNGFLDSNRDEIPDALKAILRVAKNNLLAHLVQTHYPEEKKDDNPKEGARGRGRPLREPQQLIKRFQKE